MAHDLVLQWLSPRPASQSYVIHKPSGALWRRKRKHVQCEQRGVLYVCHLLLSMSLLCGEKRKNLRDASPSTWSCARFSFSPVSQRFVVSKGVWSETHNQALAEQFTLSIVCFGSCFAQLKFLASYTPHITQPTKLSALHAIVSKARKAPFKSHVVHKTSSWT